MILLVTIQITGRWRFLDSTLMETDVELKVSEGYFYVYNRGDRYELPKGWYDQSMTEALIYLAKDFQAVIVSRPEVVSERIKQFAGRAKVNSWGQVHIPYGYTRVIQKGDSRHSGSFFFSLQEDGSLALTWKSAS